MKVSIVTPTYYRFRELPEFFSSLEVQTCVPYQVILVDGSPPYEKRSEKIILEFSKKSNLDIEYYRKDGGTAIQRNYGVSMASGDIILFIDDDVRLKPNFIEILAGYFSNDLNKEIGGITGYRTNCYFDMMKNLRWNWYKRLGLLKIFEPGKYDISTGIPINNNGQPVFSGLREVDFMTTACTAYRKEVFDEIKLDPFFVGYGILEDAQFSLRVKYHLGKKLFQCGDAHCIELSASSGRTGLKKIGERTVINYYYTFNSVFGPLSISQKSRFIRFQLFEWFRALADLFRFHDKDSLRYFLGKTSGLYTLFIKYL
jgi:glycosyltransferase involved in cell wall biosynthesis